MKWVLLVTIIYSNGLTFESIPVDDGMHCVDIIGKINSMLPKGATLKAECQLLK